MADKPSFDLSSLDLSALGVEPAKVASKVATGAADVVLYVLLWGAWKPTKSGKDAHVAALPKAPKGSDLTDAQKIVARQLGGKERWFYADEIKGALSIGGRLMVAASASYFAAKDMTGANGALLDDGGAGDLLGKLKDTNHAAYRAVMEKLGTPLPAAADAPQTPPTTPPTPPTGADKGKGK